MKQSCVTCAWRGSCNKKFSIADPSRCPDYARDVSLPLEEAAPEDDIRENTGKPEKNSENNQ